MGKTLYSAVMVFFMFLALARDAGAVSFKVIVNKDNLVSSLSKGELEKIFMKQTTSWDVGRKISPVDLLPSSTVREVFSEAILGKPVNAIVNYWQRQIFTGRKVPPAELTGEKDVVSFVQGEPGAIGYVSETFPIEGVKVLTITDRSSGK